MSDEPMVAKKGLEGLIADDSAISDVDIHLKRLTYRGYDINDLCAKSDFLEVGYLVLHGELPTQAEYDDFVAFERRNREVPDLIYDTFKKLPSSAHPMDCLRLGVTLTALHDEENRLGENSREENLRKAKLLLAKIPTIIANSHRAIHGQEIVRPRDDLSFGHNLLHMIRGEVEVERLMIEVVDTTLILYAEHGFNASTFCARVAASTLSDLYSAVAAAIGTLKGPLHGGANEQVMYMLKEIGEPAKVRDFTLSALREKRKIMGFGHRVYRTGDSRTEIIKRKGLELAQKLGETRWHEMCQIMEDTMREEKGICTNLDFPVAPAYYLCGIPIELYTPMFAASRISGWGAHIIEQHDDNRLIRPKAKYIGPAPRPFVERGKR